MMLLRPVWDKGRPHNTSKDGGKVVENITEDFNQDNYDEKELKTFRAGQRLKIIKKESGNKASNPVGLQ